MTPDADGNAVADPWQFDAYYEQATGSIRVDFGYSWPTTAGAAGRVVIVHDYAGTRISCAQMPSA